jgi:predicted MPP superfamily phosphohydrolase
LRRLGLVTAFVLAAGAGAIVAVALAGSVAAPLGPFETTLRAVPGGSGGTEVELAPFGRIDIDSHDGPVHLQLSVDELREDRARAIAEDPEDFQLDEAALTDQLRSGVRRLVARVLLAATIGGALGGVAARRRWSSLLAGGLVGLVLAGATAGWAAATWDARALAEPRYHGLLRYAPDAVGDAREVVDRFNDYQAQVAGLIENVLSLYQDAEDLRSFQPDATTVRVLHVSDLHLNPQGFDLIEQVASQFDVDVVVDTGDINDWGTTFEGSFADRIGDLDVPYVFIRGNHDSKATAASVARQPNAIVLDGDRTEVAGLDIWGIGDPRFTPDKSRAGSGDDEQQVAEDEAPIVARKVRALSGSPPDLVLVHDPRTAADLGGVAPVVLAGHLHRPDEQVLDGTTRLLVEGSTGGAGLRGLQKDAPVPLTCSVLYLDSETGRLEALDRIEVAGVDQADVRIEREVIDPDAAATDAGPVGERSTSTSTMTTTTRPKTTTTTTRPTTSTTTGG